MTRLEAILAICAAAHDDHVSEEIGFSAFAAEQMDRQRGSHAALTAWSNATKSMMHPTCTELPDRVRAAILVLGLDEAAHAYRLSRERLEYFLAGGGSGYAS